MAARHGYRTHQWRTELLSLRSVILDDAAVFRDVFVIWARCKWDGKVRGFLLDKECYQILSLDFIPTS